jgi:hypothetical protein
MDEFKNYAYSTLAAGIAIDATSCAVATGTGSRFPSSAFDAVIWDASYPSATAAVLDGAGELVRVTARSTDACTITRAQGGTSAVALNVSGKVYAFAQVLTAATLTGLVSQASLVTPTGTINSSNTVFTLPDEPLGDIVVYQNGLAVAEDGYAVSGDELTFDVAPTTGDTLQVLFAPTTVGGSGGGSGTVTAVSVASANGFTGTVANATSTPAITIIAGAITPTSVNGVTLSGSSTPTLAVTGTSAISGTNTGDNAVNSLYSSLVTNATHTGDATGSGALTLATVNANVGSFGSATAAGTFTVNAKGLVTAAGSTTVTPAVGSITGLGTNVATALAVNVGSAGAPVVNGGALGTPSSGTLTSCTGLPTAGIVDAAVTLAKMANLAQDQFIVRTTASTGVPQTATVTAAARTVLDDATVSAMLDTLGGASATGTGGVVRATSPTLVTPALGTPSSGTLTSCTVKVEFGFACSDETTALTTGEKVAFYAPFAFTLTGVYACVTQTPAGSAVTVDVEKPAGTTLLSAVASISAGSFNASGTVSGGTQSIAQGDRVSIDIDQIGSGTAGAGLKVFLTGTRT